MLLFAAGLGYFATAWLVHLVWWRIRLPRHHTGTLLKIFALVPVALSATLWGSTWAGAWTWVEWLALGLFHAGSTGCYLITYAGVEATSPSLVIIRALAAAAPRGMTVSELQPLIRDEEFILPRLYALERDHFVESEDSVIRLTARGRSAARSAHLIARIFGLGLAA